MLYSDEVSRSLWSGVNNLTQVDQSLDFARNEFGPGGTQCGRRWFYRLRNETYYIKVDVTDKSWKQIPRTRYWCDIYFRDPKDATWFQLKLPNN